MKARQMQLRTEANVHYEQARDSYNNDDAAKAKEHYLQAIALLEQVSEGDREDYEYRELSRYHHNVAVCLEALYNEGERNDEDQLSKEALDWYTKSEALRDKIKVKNEVDAERKEGNDECIKVHSQGLFGKVIGLPILHMAKDTSSEQEQIFDPSATRLRN